MKKFYFLVASLALFSCGFDDENQTQMFDEFLPIESVEIPSEFKVGETQEISLIYSRPTDCHAFRNILFEEKEDSRIVVVVSTKFLTPGEVCENINLESQASFNVTPLELDSYIFKFWQGKDEQGEDIFFKIEVPVVN